MLKSLEATDPNSCWNKARDDQIVFVVLDHDPAAPATIRRWIMKRIELGLNKSGDAKLVEAEECAVEIERRLAGPLPGQGVLFGGDEGGQERTA